VATVDGAATGLTSAMMIAIFGTAPLAVGVLALQDAAAWESASSHYALIIAQLIAVLTVAVFGVRVARFGQPTGRVPAEVAARIHHGRYLTDEDFDRRSRVLLHRAQDAIDAVTSSEVCQAGLIDKAASATALADQEWDLATALREQARLRSQRSGLAAAGAGPVTSGLLEQQRRASRLAEASITARVEALETYAAEVRDADAAYADRRQAEALAELHGQHLDMLARTAADEHGIAEIEAMSQQARAVRIALREPR
jgi:hypothetical protein